MPHDHRRDAEALRMEMANVRSTLDENVDELVVNARALTDWRYYVKAAPWGAIGAAAALGYLAVPRKVQIVTPDADELARLAKRHQIVVEQKAKPDSRQAGVTQVVMTMVANALLRTAASYVSQQAEKIFGQQTATMERPRQPQGKEEFNAEVRQP